MKILAIFASLVAIAYARPGEYRFPASGYLPVTGSGKDLETYNQVEEEKHVYFYGSPNDEQYTHYRINVIPKSKKNTKIIFVKTPHHAGVIPHVNAPASLTEDRTLVYVLNKNPIQSQSIRIPAGLGVKQLKPEVFFLKYNNKYEAEAQVNGGVQGERVGVNVPDLPNESVFINALGNGEERGYHYDAPSVLALPEVPVTTSAPVIPSVPVAPSARTDPSTFDVPETEDQSFTHVEIGEENKDEQPETRVDSLVKPLAFEETITNVDVSTEGKDETVKPHTTLIATDDDSSNKDEDSSTIVDLGNGVGTDGSPE